MKVVTSQQMASIETMAFRDGASEWDFMEEAGSGVALVVQDYIERYSLGRNVTLLCGKGNNAGDAYVAGIHLLHLDFHVEAFQLGALKDCSPLCQQNAQRFQNDGGKVKEIENAEEIDFP